MRQIKKPPPKGGQPKEKNMTTLTDLNEITGEVEKHAVETCGICGEECERFENKNSVIVCNVCIDAGIYSATDL